MEPVFNGIFSRNNLPRIKHIVYVKNLDEKIVKEHIGFHYLLTKMLLYTLILLELNIFLNIFRTHNNESITCDKSDILNIHKYLTNKNIMK